MAKIVPYIMTSPGVAKKQMQYYADSIGAKIVSQIPFTQDIMKQFAPEKSFSDEELANSVMHGELSFGGSPIYLACSKDEQTHTGDIQIFLGFKRESEKEVAKGKEIFETFAKDGQIIQPLQEQFWGDIFGIVKDKFDITWQVMISSDQATEK